MADGSSETVQVGACEVDPPSCEGTEVVVDGGSWQSEVSWTISDCDGNELFAGGAPYAECLDLPENFIINMFDAFGDGWNGNIMSLDGDGTNGGTGILTIAMGEKLSIS